MIFAPESTILLFNVDFDKNYKNVVYFKDIDEKGQYFSVNSKYFVRSFADYTTVRMTNPDGSPRTAVRVGMGIDEFNAKPANYMLYQNPNLGGKWIHAFIVAVNYINEGVTELVIETDVFQTWFWDANFKDSYVEREHSETDLPGDNIIPESFNTEEFNYYKLTNDDAESWGYLITATEQLGSDLYRGITHSGIYQGLYFYFYTTWGALNEALNALEAEGGECIVSISTIPYSNLLEAGMTEMKWNETNGWVDSCKKTGFVGQSSTPSYYNINISNMIMEAVDGNGYGYEFKYNHQGYTPKNNKLYTFPFYCITISNHNGQEGQYKIEDFEDNGTIYFEMCGDISSSPTRCIYPRDYKGINKNYDAGIQSAPFPQCAFNTDTYKLWLAKNQYTQALNYTASGVGMLSSILTLNGEGIASSAMNIANTMNAQYQASREPNRATQGNSNNNLLTALGFNKFDFYIRTLRKDLAISIDNYFTMFGYQTNKIKMPNLNSRPYFNYVKTIDINVSGAIPMDDMERFKSIFNNGVTLWKPNATIGNYKVNNAPV